MTRIMMTHTLKTTLTVLCTVSFLSGCVATQEVPVDVPPDKPSMERLSSGEQFPSRIIPVQPAVQRLSGKKRQSNAQTQSMKELQLMYLSYLKKEGYLPKIDSDGDVLFKKEGKNYFIDVEAQQKDPNYFRMVLPNFWSIENDIERLEVLVAADQVNSTIKLVKVHTVKDDTWASVQIFVSNQEDFQDFFPRMMSILSGGVELFVKKMREIKSKKI